MNQTNMEYQNHLFQALREDVRYKEIISVDYARKQVDHANQEGIVSWRTLIEATIGKWADIENLYIAADTKIPSREFLLNTSNKTSYKEYREATELLPWQVGEVRHSDKLERYITRNEDDYCPFGNWYRNIMKKHGITENDLAQHLETEQAMEAEDDTMEARVPSAGTISQEEWLSRKVGDAKRVVRLFLARGALTRKRYEGDDLKRVLMGAVLGQNRNQDSQYAKRIKHSMWRTLLNQSSEWCAFSVVMSEKVNFISEDVAREWLNSSSKQLFKKHFETIIVPEQKAIKAVDDYYSGKTRFESPPRFNVFDEFSEQTAEIFAELDSGQMSFKPSFTALYKLSVLANALENHWTKVWVSSQDAYFRSDNIGKKMKLADARYTSLWQKPALNKKGQVRH